jgi:hypothetical protein
VEPTVRLIKQIINEPKTNSSEIRQLNQGQHSNQLTNKLTWYEMKEQEVNYIFRFI